MNNLMIKFNDNGNFTIMKSLLGGYTKNGMSLSLYSINGYLLISLTYSTEEAIKNDIKYLDVLFDTRELDIKLIKDILQEKLINSKNIKDVKNTELLNIT